MKFPILEGMLPRKALASKPSKPIKKPLDVVPQFEAAIQQNKASNQIHISSQTIKRPTEMLKTNRQLRYELAAAEAKVQSLETRIKASTAAAKFTAQSAAQSTPGKPGAVKPPSAPSRRTAAEFITLPEVMRQGIDHTAAHMITAGREIREELQDAFNAADTVHRAAMRVAFPKTFRVNVVR